MADQRQRIDRRGLLGGGLRVAGAAGLGGLAGLLATRHARPDDHVWQIDPEACIACEKCETMCVLDVSAVRAVQCYLMCGYCDVCTGYFPTEDFELDTAAENQLCPTGAISRTFVEERAGERFFEYNIDESLCIGCGKCVKGCELMNGSLYLQVRHDLCLNCNECAIAVACPPQAFRRVPAHAPTLLKHGARAALERKLAELSRREAGPLSQEQKQRLEKSKRQVQEALDRDARPWIGNKAARQ